MKYFDTDDNGRLLPAFNDLAAPGKYAANISDAEAQEIITRIANGECLCIDENGELTTDNAATLANAKSRAIAENHAARDNEKAANESARNNLILDALKFLAPEPVPPELQTILNNLSFLDAAPATAADTKTAAINAATTLDEIAALPETEYTPPAIAAKR